jgi:hypothetical protein
MPSKQPIANITRKQAKEVAARLTSQPPAGWAGASPKAGFKAGAKIAKAPPKAGLPLFESTDDLLAAVDAIAAATAKSSPEVFAAVTDLKASQLQEHIQKKAIEAGKAYVTPLGVIAYLQFDSGDLAGWIGSAVERLGSERCPPSPRPSGVDFPVLQNGRVAFLSDWGTGCHGAPAIGRWIQELDSQAPWGLVLHGGDTYYAGLVDEVEERLIAGFPQLMGGGYRRSLNANHDMYSGGAPYFAAVADAFGQEGSYFAFQVDGWMLVGLDTAWEGFVHPPFGMMKSGYIDTAQMEWLREVLEFADAANLNLALFSHHQPFHFSTSKASVAEEPMVSDLAWFLGSDRVKVWYWGHEHAAVRYGAHPRYGFIGRCVGHGGVPVKRASKVKKSPQVEVAGGVYSWNRLPFGLKSPTNPGSAATKVDCLVLDGPSSHVPALLADAYAPQGWVQLEFVGSSLFETWFVVDNAGNSEVTARILVV